MNSVALPPWEGVGHFTVAGGGSGTLVSRVPEAPLRSHRSTAGSRLRLAVLGSA